MGLWTLRSSLARPGVTVGVVPTNYRRGSAEQRCGNCAYGPLGGYVCTMWHAPVRPGMLCNRWEHR